MEVTTAANGSPQHDVERMLSQVFEFAPNGVALTRADGRVMLANAELERMFGYSRPELLGLTIEQLVPERFRVGHSMLRSGDGFDPRSRAMGAGRELLGVRADGTEFPIEIGLSALQTPNGMLVIETIVDISVRKRLERMFQRMVEAAPCAMVMIDALGRIVLVNPQAELMFGYGRVDLIGNPLEMLLPERFRGAHAQHRTAFAVAPYIRQMGVGRDLTARRKDGTEFPVEIGLNPVPGEEGGLVLAAVTDITRRKAMELELRQVHANLEEFTYAASHDLKSPLRGIADLIEWIREDLGGQESEAVARNLGRVTDRVHRLERVIDDLLTYAQASAVCADVVLIEPRVLIEEVLAIQSVPPAFQLVVQVDAAPFATAKTPLETVLRNLVGNAIQHHHLPDGKIEIRARDLDRYCVFTVSDDGPGIPAAAHARVFRMFQSLLPTGRGSSGIGLALSKRLVESHGGRIELESAADARGTSIRVWWPRFQWKGA